MPPSRRPAHRPPSPAVTAVALAATALAACADPVRPGGGGGDSAGAPVVERPVPDSLALPVVPGGRLWVYGDARDSLRTPADTLVRFAVADTGVATVDSLGQVTGRRAGRTVVVASAAGRSVRLAVVIRPVRYREVWPSFEGDGCALTTDGEALCWGANLNGALGAETLRSCAWRSPASGWTCGSWPSDAPTFVRTRARFTTLATGWGVRCGLTVDARAVCWGTRFDRPGGIIPCADTLSHGRCDYAPREVTGAPRWTRLAIGAERFSGTVCALDEGGLPWCWGADWAGNAGAPGGAVPGGSDVPAPTPVPGAPRLRDLALGPVVSCGLDAQDAVWCWGWPRYFGNDPAGTPSVARRPVPAAAGLHFAALSMHGGGCGLTRDGEAWCWWDGVRASPAAPGLRLVAISAGETVACGLTGGGEAWCWPYAFPPQRIDAGVRLRTLAVQESEACGMGVDERAYCVTFARLDAGPLTNVRVRALAGQP